MSNFLHEVVAPNALTKGLLSWPSQVRENLAGLSTGWEIWPAREGREREKESQMGVRGLRNRAGERRKVAWNKLWANDTAETS